MQEEAIAQRLEQACQDPSLIFQVTQHDTELQICINRELDQPIDYSALQQRICDAIASLQLPQLRGLWLYSRVLGTVDPDWQTYVSLPTEEAIFDAAIAPADKEATDASQPSKSQYCFIRNRLMLTAELVPPSQELARLIQVFHDSPVVEKQTALPLLEQFFRNAESIAENISQPLQEWFKQLKALNSADARKASIWFSRYCFDPDATMAVVNRVLDASAVPPSKSEATSSETAESVPAASTVPNPDAGICSEEMSSVRQRPSQTGVRPRATTSSASIGEPGNESFPPPVPASLRSRVSSPKSIQISPWAVIVGQGVLAMLIVTTIAHLTAPPSIAQLCRRSQSQYCHLAAQLAGQSILQQATQRSPHLADGMDTEGRLDCEEIAWRRVSANSGTTPQHQTFTTRSEEVLPSILLVDVQFKETPGRVEASPPRIACVLQGVAGRRMSLLASDAIPNGWPQQTYKGKPLAESIHRSFTIYGTLLEFGANTLFTAIGLFVVSMVGLSICFYSLDGLIKTSVILGCIETILAMLPHFLGFMGGIALESVALLVTSAVVKDLKIDWAAGYRTVSLGVLAFMVIRWLLHLLLFTVILSLV